MIRKVCYRAAGRCCLLLSCGGTSTSSGLEEPIRIAGAQFRVGPLPGSAPLTSKEVSKGKLPEEPHSTSIDVSGSILSQNEVAFSLSGRASKDAYAVAFKAEDYGTGYWLLPVGSPDPTNQGELAWRARLDLGPDIGTGLRSLLVAAIGADGQSGTQSAFQFCVRNPVEDNLNSCLPTLAPPELVVSLGWQSAADLDLRIVDSEGNTIDSQHPRGDAKSVKGRLSRDANANCSGEGAPRENILWDKKPAAGVYYVYVDLKSACGESAVPYVVTTHVSQRTGSEFAQLETYRVSGELISLQTSTGSVGTFVTELTVE